MSGRLCVYVRDRLHPADLYDSSGHFFAVAIHEIGSGGPLIWKGVNYNWVWLPFPGEFGRVAGEFEVPAGEYLVRGYAMCSNVVTHVAWVQVKDGEMASVNLVPNTVHFCIQAALLGVKLGTAILGGKEGAIAELAPEEAAAFEKAGLALAGKLARDPGMPLMAADELRKRFRETPK
jgi:hypothetical protein